MHYYFTCTYKRNCTLGQRLSIKVTARASIALPPSSAASPSPISAAPLLPFPVNFASFQVTFAASTLFWFWYREYILVVGVLVAGSVMTVIVLDKSLGRNVWFYIFSVKLSVKVTNLSFYTRQGVKKNPTIKGKVFLL